MSLLFMDSLQWVASGTTSTTLEGFLSEKYVDANVDSGAQKGIINAEADSGQALQFGNFTNDFLTLPVDGNPVTVVVGFRFYTGSAPTSDSPDFVRIRNSGDTEQVSVNWDDNLNLIVRRGSAVLKQITWVNGRLDEWFHFEMKVTINNSTGSVEIRINEEVLINESGLDTYTSGAVDIGSIRLHQPTTGTGWSLKDLYVLDTTGSTNNDFLGMNKFVHLLLPNADGDDEDWTLSAGTDSFALIDEVNHDSDTSYIESSTSTNQTLVNYEATGSESNILGVMVGSTVRLDSAGSEDFQHVAKEGTTEADSSTITVDSTTYGQKLTVFETNPDTAAAWTSAELDGAQFGVEYQ